MRHDISGAANAPFRCKNNEQTSATICTLTILFAVAAFVIGAAAPAEARARTQTFIVSTGERVTVLPLEEVDTCEEVEQVQRQIDNSRYRVGSPATVTDPRDRPLLEYELEVAKRAYSLCPNQRGVTDRFHSFGGSR